MLGPTSGDALLLAARDAAHKVVAHEGVLADLRMAQAE